MQKTISFLQDEMLHPQGGFYAALDADSEGEEGKFYVWDKKEVETILGSDAGLFCEFFDISEKGNWEHKNILRVLKTEEKFVKEKQLDKKTFLELKETCLQKLLVERNRRVRPGLDDKIILGWNALAIKAMAKAAIVLQDETYKQLAVKAFDFVLSHFSINGNSDEMRHTWKNGIAKYPAFLDDYAYLIDAALEMYSLTFNTDYLLWAKNICSYAIDNFSDSDKLFFYYTHQGQQDVIARKKEVYDGATPSGNAVMAHVLHRLSILFEEREWGQRAESMIKGVSQAIIKYPSSFGVWASLLQQKINGADEIAIVGQGAHKSAFSLQSKHYLPAKIVMASSVEEAFPMLRNKKPSNFIQIFLCRNSVCYPAFTTEEALLRMMKGQTIH